MNKAIGSGNHEKPCPECQGKGTVIRKDGDKEIEKTCPMCRGTKKSDGLIRK